MYELTNENIAIDAEWEEVPMKNCEFLTTQIAISNNSGEIVQYLLFINEDLYDKEIHQLDKYRNIPIDIIPWKIGREPIINYFSVVPKKLNVYLFYSPIDCECFLGTKNWEYLIDNNFVNRKKNLYISWTKNSTRKIIINQNIKESSINFIDVFGRVGCSLEEAYKTLGIDTNDGKDYIKEFDVDKSKMKEFFTDHPIEFIRYSLGDLDLHKLCVTLYSYMNEIIEECFGLKDLFSSLKEYPGTIGSLVNTIFTQFLEHKYPAVLHRLSYLSNSADDKKSLKLKEILNSLKNTETVKTKKILNLKGVIHGLGAGSVPAFFPGNYDKSGQSPYGAVVHGGRTVKEEEVETKFFDVFDIDLKSAYGSALNQFDYPFGLPTCVSLTNHSTKKDLTLKSILSRYKKQLIDGLYVIYVSGNLKKAQDLIISKYGLTTEKIGGRILTNNYEDNDDTFKGRLGGEVLLTTQQIELGVITSDVLKVLKAVCTNSELSDIYKLKVNLLVYYPQEKELSIDNWVEKYKDYKSINPSRLASRDLRSRDWCRFKLSEFLNPLLEKREEFKRLSEKDELYITKQKLLKLIINTVYGDLASPFFQMGNTIVANNITANVRTSVWLMSKALGTKITVTDGGFYEYKKVNFLKTHLKTFLKPSLNGLIKPTLHTSIGLKELVKDFDYKTCSREIIDELALKHIKDFWILYGIDFIAPIEHKYENCSISAYTSPYTKVDYVLNTYEGKKLVKIRGVKPSQILIHPKAEVLRAIEDGREINFQSAQLIEIMGISQYRKSVDKSVLPGHVYIVETNYRPNKNAPKLFPNYPKYKNSVYAYNERKSKYEKDLLSDPDFGFFKG